MQEYNLPRIHKDDLCFYGDFIVKVDDREWLGMTANWLELDLYGTDDQQFVLSSTFYQNYPRGNKVFNASKLESLNEVKEHLVHSGTPNMIIDALLQRSKRIIESMARKNQENSNVLA